MKFKLLLFAVLSILIFSCTVESPEDPLNVYRNIAYTALSPAQKASVLGDWQKAEVAAWTNGNYVVVFQTKDNQGLIRVVVDPETGKMVEILI
jgi:hypothetical protein